MTTHLSGQPRARPNSTSLSYKAGDGAGCGNIERVNAVAHGDDCSVISLCAPALAEAVALGAQQKGKSINSGQRLG